MRFIHSIKSDNLRNLSYFIFPIPVPPYPNTITTKLMIILFKRLYSFFVLPPNNKVLFGIR